jgi:hypothetical protein
MAETRNVLDRIERLPTLIVAGTRFLAKELADGHGLEQKEWLYIDSIAKVNAFKAEEIMFGRGAEKVPEIRGIVEMSKTFGHKVVFGDYPKLTGETDASASLPPPTPPAPPAAPPAPPTDAAPERRDMRRRENRPPVRKGDEIKDVLGEITAMEGKYEALLRKLITIAERKLAVLGELKTEGEEG